MKWITHQTFALTAAVWCQASASVTAGLLCGAVLPDLAEQLITGRNKAAFMRIHRGLLHWFGLYVALLLAVLVAPLPPAQCSLLAGVALGALSHLFMDGLNPTGVPLLPLRRTPRFRWNMVATGSVGEWCLLGVLLVLLSTGGYQVSDAWLRRMTHFF